MSDEAKKYNQTEFANLIGVSVSTVKRWAEKGIVKRSEYGGYWASDDEIKRLGKTVYQRKTKEGGDVI